jgi:hypothetical protein
VERSGCRAYSRALTLPRSFLRADTASDGHSRQSAATAWIQPRPRCS